MRQKRLKIFGWLFLCVVCFFAGRKSVKMEVLTLQERTKLQEVVIVPTESEQREFVPETYYLVVIEEKMLRVYEMPKKELYESYSLDDLWIPEEEELLNSGISFKTLGEVYEFLENIMS